MESFEQYLTRHHRPSTAQRYLRDVKAYLLKNPDSQTAGYKDIMDYIGYLRKAYSNKATVNRILCSIKKYYSYLVATGARVDNPAKNIRLKNYHHTNINLTDLFTAGELEGLMNEKLWPRKSVAQRNKVLISLMIYQGLTKQELLSVKTYHLDLEKTSITIPGTAKTNTRKLALKSAQIMLLHGYVTVERPKFLKKSKTTTDILLLDWYGKPITGDVIRGIIRYCKKFFPEKNLTATTIRMSVVANLLKSGEDLRRVQVFAGHKYPSSTERYKQNQVEELKAAIDKFYPLG